MKTSGNLTIDPAVAARIIDQAKKEETTIIEQRRDFHRNPEIGFEEVRTGSIIKKELTTLGFEVAIAAQTGVVGLLRNKPKSPFIALRADIDALALNEESECSYRSIIPGRMHACGHDAHAAMLLGAARIIARNRQLYTGNVKFIFQPAEEGGGGARFVINDGHFDDVDAVAGIHVWISIEAGRFATRSGPFFAAADEIKIAITGKGGHAAYPNLCIDPTAVGADIYNALQKIVSREVSPFQNCVISITSMAGADAHNIIPQRMSLAGTIRSFDQKLHEFLLQRIREVVENYSRAWRCTGTVELAKVGYPALVNDQSIVNTGIAVAGMLGGEVEEAEPTLGGEDFAFYAQKCKGAMFLLGVSHKEKEKNYPHHHPRFDIDESVLWKGSAFYALLALEYMLNQV